MARATPPQLRKYLTPAWSCLLLLALMTFPSLAHAKDMGIAADGCSGCHAGGKDARVTITASTDTVALGQKVRLSIAIEGLNGTKGGLYFRATDGVGKLDLVPSEPTKKIGAGITHSSPKTREGDSVTFLVDWTAPAQAGDVEFFAFGLSANGDGRSGGDGPGQGYLSLVFGCAGNKYYADHDLDGHGSMDGDYRMACSKPERFAESADDCDNYEAKIHPGAVELCNGRDDDCNGQSDEALPSSTYCEDKDLDGHGVRGGKTSSGCGPLYGFGLCDDDCNDADKTIYPTAQELCNYRDDNCDNRSDENARTTCGVGWCRRSSESCNMSLCVPGQPRTEECNALDDDCDGEVDEGAALCAAGEVCQLGECIDAKKADAGTRPSGGDAGPALLVDAGRTEGAASMDASSAPSSPPSSDTESGCSARRRSGASSGLGVLAMLAIAGWLLAIRRAHARP